MNTLNCHHASSVSGCNLSEYRQRQDQDQKEYDTESAIEFVCLLDFKIEESKKESFLNEFERALETSAQEHAQTDMNEALANFFMKHVSKDGTIVA